MQKNLKEAWEIRAKTFQNKKESVMQQSLPSLLKDYVDKFQKQEIVSLLPNYKCKVLDVGCGYGRIAEAVVMANRNAYVYGIDISETFVDLFNRKFKGKAQATSGDVRYLPFENESFDLVFSVASLLYLESEDGQKRAIHEIFRVLKRDGIVVIIEPHKSGWNIVNFFGLIPFVLRKILRKKKVETFEIPFSGGRIEKLIKINKGILISRKGYPAITFMFVPVLIFSKTIPLVARFMLSLSEKIDRIFSPAKFSYWITYVAKK